MLSENWDDELFRALNEKRKNDQIRAVAAQAERLTAEDFEPHTCTPESCPVSDDNHYYVTAVDGTHPYLMAGPYATHAEALSHVDEALAIANKHDPRAWFMSWGTAKSSVLTVGRLQKAGLMKWEQ